MTNINVPIVLEQVHRSFPKAGNEINGHQIEVAVNEAAQTKFGFAILPGTVLNHLLSYLCKTSLFGNVWNVSVHFTVHFDTLHHLAAIRFQTTVKIVQFDAGYFAGSKIVEFAR